MSETPSSLSSSQFIFHLLVKYLKLVRVDCHVPSIVASSTFFSKEVGVSSLLTTASVKLQNSRGLRIISEHGLVPKSSLSSLLSPLSGLFMSTFKLLTCFLALALLNIPRSPDFELYKACHSFRNVHTSGLP